MNLFINPSPSEYTEDGAGSGGIWRVINAMARWLPEYGIDIVDTEPEADVVCVHAGALVQTSKPIVTVNHGLYWTGDNIKWPREQWAWNVPVIEALREAHKIVVPSEWVAQSIRRDMKKSPAVIPHGIEFDEFEPMPHDGYVLWAKPRVDVVSDPRPVNELAARALNIRFVSTFGRPAQNVEIIGARPYDEFCKIMASAMVWLATTRETGDIASREAMAYGIPVLGWDWGATGGLVVHKKTGYLAKPGDYDDLLAGLQFCIENRAELGENARDYVQMRFQWKDVMRKYAAVIQDAYDADQYEVEVSVIVPAYNYGDYLPECIESVRAQDFDSVELIVVDDASTDNTQAVLSEYEGLNVIRHPSNRGLVGALNTGHEAARGRYFINLDADNVMANGAIRKLHTAMEAKPWVDVGTGPYSIYGQEIVNGGDVDVQAQLDHNNQIPSTCIIRARSIKRLGGYRARQAKNEDAEFWCRAMSAGLRCEYLVGDPVFAYRWHGKNKSSTEGGEDEPESPESWNFYYPWRRFPDITPFACLTKPEQHSHKVRSYERPHIAVIIPVGPGHEHFVVDALDSVYAQTFREFECIVANDTGNPLDVAALGHPWVKVIDTGRSGPATARNRAIEAAKAPLIVPLDADDQMFPDTLMMYYLAWLQHPDSLVYADCFVEDEPGKRVYYHSGKWTMDKIKKEAIYQNVILFAKQWWEDVGGYPTDQLDNMWEDWLFGVKLHICGVGATYIKDHVWGTYRHWPAAVAGASKNSVDNAGHGTDEFKQKYKILLEWIAEKEDSMACKGCGKNKLNTRIVVPFSHQAEPLPGGEQMQVICTQQGLTGYISLNSRATPGKKYRYKTDTILTLDIGDEWAQRHKHFARYIPDPEPKIAELPKEPPVVTKLTEPVQSKVPVVAKRAEPEPEPQAADLPVHDLGLSEALSQKLFNAGFKTKSALRADILKTAGANIKAIKGIGNAALVSIRQAVFG